jgi:hypothetical protein
MKTCALQQKKTTATLFHGGDTFTCAYHPKTKIPTLRCIADNKIRTTHIQAASTLAQQPSNRGCEHAVFRKPDHATTPTAYASNLKRSQQEMLRLHETYAHADTKEIQTKIKKLESKANRQAATCLIPKCLSRYKNKGKKRSHKQHCGSITQNDSHPGSNTSIEHVDAANVPGYTWQQKGRRPTLRKLKKIMLFVDHKTSLVYPSFQESKTVSEACRSKCDYEKFAQRYRVTVKSYHAVKGLFRSERSTK